VGITGRMAKRQFKDTFRRRRPSIINWPAKALRLAKTAPGKICKKCVIFAIFQLTIAYAKTILTFASNKKEFLAKRPCLIGRWLVITNLIFEKKQEFVKTQ
jgi:hypothetical protein